MLAKRLNGIVVVSTMILSMPREWIVFTWISMLLFDEGGDNRQRTDESAVRGDDALCILSIKNPLEIRARNCSQSNKPMKWPTRKSGNVILVTGVLWRPVTLHSHQHDECCRISAKSVIRGLVDKRDNNNALR